MSALALVVDMSAAAVAQSYTVDGAFVTRLRILGLAFERSCARILLQRPVQRTLAGSECLWAATCAGLWLCSLASLRRIRHVRDAGDLAWVFAGLYGMLRRAWDGRCCGGTLRRARQLLHE